MAIHNFQKNRSIKATFIHGTVITFLIACLLLISGCDSGSSSNNTSFLDNTKPSNITPAIESIILVSPTESGAINSITYYPQKILIAGIDKYGSRKLLGPEDGLTFKLQNKWYGSIDESGILSTDIPGETSLIISLNNKIFLNIPLKIQKTVLEEITTTVNESNNLSSITIAKNYHIPIKAVGKFRNGQTLDISNYVGLWSSSNANVAFESDCITGPNLFPANSTGTAQITAKLDVVESSILINTVDASLTKISLTPNISYIPINSNTNMKAIGTFNNKGAPIELNITNNLIWKIESTKLATINNTTGTLITHESIGNIIIKAMAPTGESSASSLNISDTIFKSVFIKNKSNGNPIESITIYEGGSIIIYPYAEYVNGKNVNFNVNDPKNDCKWLIESENQRTITFDGSSGTKATLQGNIAGNTSITLSCQNNILQYRTHIHVTNAIPNKLIIESNGSLGPTGTIKLPVGAHENLHGVVYYSNGESSIVYPGWNIQDENIASIDSNNALTGKGIGNTLIKAIINISGRQLATIESIEVSAATLQKIILQGDTTVVSGTSKIFKAIGQYSNDRQYDISESVTWKCEFPIISCNQGLVIAESKLQDSRFAKIKVTDQLTNINSESNINIVPVAMIALTFDNNIAFSKCSNLGNSAICYIQFLAIYNDGSRKIYKDFDRNSSSFQIFPQPSDITWPNPNTYLAIQYVFPPLPETVKIIAKSKGFESELTFKVNKVF